MEGLFLTSSFDGGAKWMGKREYMKPLQFYLQREVPGSMTHMNTVG